VVAKSPPKPRPKPNPPKFNVYSNRIHFQR
jgi:hypothetical protein